MVASNYSGRLEQETRNHLPPASDDMSVAALHRKVVEDIQFLEDRIDRVKRQPTPNSALLKTYQNMLDSRRSVLEWLQQHDGIGQDFSQTG